MVNLSDRLAVYSNTVISRVTFGGDAEDLSKKKQGGGERLMKAFGKIHELLGTAPMGETVPWLRWMDALVTGLEAEKRRAFQEMDAVLDRVIADHRQKRRLRAAAAGAEDDDDEDRDLVDVLLEEYGGSSEEEEGAVKGIILDMLAAAAATDSTSTLLEWAMAELINHPKELLKLQHEIRDAVDRSGAGAVMEEHLRDLPYLEAVVRESKRPHPSMPLRETRQDTELLGYAVRKGTRVLTNFWAIGRDQDVWGQDAEEFVPERFLGYDDDLKMLPDFPFLPLGARSRFAMTSNKLALASLAYSFDWELPGGWNEKVDVHASSIMGASRSRRCWSPNPMRATGLHLGKGSGQLGCTFVRFLFLKNVVCSILLYCQ